VVAARRARAAAVEARSHCHRQSLPLDEALPTVVVLVLRSACPPIGARVGVWRTPARGGSAAVAAAAPDIDNEGANSGEPSGDEYRAACGAVRGDGAAVADVARGGTPLFVPKTTAAAAAAGCATPSHTAVERRRCVVAVAVDAAAVSAAEAPTMAPPSEREWHVAEPERGVVRWDVDPRGPRPPARRGRGQGDDAGG